MFSSPNSSFSSDGPGALPALFTWVMDVPCHVDFVLGSTRIKVRQCRDLAVGSVVNLIQAAGTDLDLCVEGVAVAAGQVVITEDRTHLRINRILPPQGSEKQ